VARATQDLLAQNIQAIVLTPAHVLEQRFDDILRVASGANVPVFAWSEGLTARGALASWGLDYADHGRRAGRIMEQVLHGARPGSIPLDMETARLLWLNAGVAQRLGITIPPEIRAQAARVIGP
jgi:putative ABC transport system substrate-binding protein